MIERFDLDAKGQADPNGAWFWVDDVAHLLRPPTWKECGECKERGPDMTCECHGSGQIPIFYTPAQWRQWFVDNRLPVQEWTGPVWKWLWVSSTTNTFGEITINYNWVVDVINNVNSFKPLICATEAGKPPDDYACES